MELSPKHEAAIVAYIALYSNCKIDTCWKTISALIKDHGQIYNGVVYRGHTRDNKTIDTRTPFFSTSPHRAMAMQFVETDWESAAHSKIGNLFKMHLVNVPVINTSQIKYTLSDDVIGELEKLVGDGLIEKGNRNYTLHEYIPRIKDTLNELVFSRNDDNADEILVLNGGSFYNSGDMTVNGTVKRKHGRMTEYETWYTVLGKQAAGRRKHSCKRKKNIPRCAKNPTRRTTASK